MYTAVIADDEVWIRKWLEQVLSNYDKEIRVAASLDDGLKVKEFLEKEEADILISDIRMPKMTGSEFLSYLKSNELFKHIPVMMLSSEESTTERIRLLEEGAVDYILKPFNPMELKVRLQKFL